MKDRRSDILFFFGVSLALWIAYSVRDVLMLIYVSALFAVVLSPAIGVIQKIRFGSWRPGRGFAIIFLFLVLVLLGTVFMVFAFPPIYRDAHQFSADWPRHLADLSEEVRHLPFGNKVDSTALEKYATEIVGGAGGLFLNLAGGIFGIFTAIILTAYFTIDGDRTLNWAVSLFPLDQQQRLARTLHRAEQRMRNWLLGQLIMMCALGLCAGVAYYALGLRYFYILALYAGISDIIPIAGPISAVALSGTVAALDSPEKVFGVIVFHAIYVQFEAAFLSPRIMRSTLKLSPLAVIVALSLGGSLAGVVGALVSVPTAALVLVLADEYLVKKPRATAAAAD
ncbi:MAG TPA: AI-2E family transporter [Candidatus Angelobacter sp.]|jgi:predicted PurR-regulated permease PerM|nr:AI-2E family transporter [Candidatus Angelobacter sp.]